MEERLRWGAELCRVARCVSCLHCPLCKGRWQQLWLAMLGLALLDCMIIMQSIGSKASVTHQGR